MTTHHKSTEIQDDVRRVLESYTPHPVITKDAQDAQRYRFVIAYLVSERTDLDNAIVAATEPDEITKVIDAAMVSVYF